MGATEMAVAKTHPSMSDDSATMQPNECLAIDGWAQAQVYTDSGYTAATIRWGGCPCHYQDDTGQAAVDSQEFSTH